MLLEQKLHQMRTRGGGDKSVSLTSNWVRWITLRILNFKRIALLHCSGYWAASTLLLQMSLKLRFRKLK